MPDEYVNATNLSTEPFTYRHVTSKVTLNPGVTTVIPYAHMVLIAGNPYAKVERGERSEELVRIKLRYNALGTENWKDICPNISFTDSEGLPFMTVLADPDGDSGVMGPGEIDLSDSAQLHAAIEKMKSQVNQLQKRLNDAEMGDIADARSDAKDDIPTVAKKPTPSAPDMRPDTPGKVPANG